MKCEIAHYEAGDEDHDDLGKPFRVVAVLRNNRLIRAREQLGYPSQAAAARAIGVEPRTLSAFESFRWSPWSTHAGTWKEVARRIARAYAYEPEELWPEVIRQVEATAMTLELGAAEVESLSPERLAESAELRAAVERALGTLPARQARVLRDRFGLGRPERLLDEVAEDLGVCRERARQLEAKALSALRGGGSEGARILRPHKDSDR